VETAYLLELAIAAREEGAGGNYGLWGNGGLWNLDGVEVEETNNRDTMSLYLARVPGHSFKHPEERLCEAPLS